MKKIILGLAVFLFTACSAKNSNNSFDVNKALKYCAVQTKRTLKELEPIDYTMMPRNIMDSLKT